MTEAILLYMPVIHKGYLDFLRRHATGSNECFLLGKQAIASLGPEAVYILRKDEAIRGLPEGTVREFIQQLEFFRRVSVLKDPADPSPRRSGISKLVGPDEDITLLGAKTFFPSASLICDDSTRLRYDRKGAKRVDPVPSTLVTSEEAYCILMGKAVKAAEHSRDWWLSVGALIARDGEVLFSSHNRAMPHADISASLGEPRSLYSRGEHTDDTLVLHAERGLVAQAARIGTPLLGTDAYVTHFPCVPCASELVEAGIRRLFFREGYSRLESASVFKASGVELIRVVC